MLKEELITTVAKKSNVSKKIAKEVIEVLIDTIKSSLVKKEKVVISRFGTFVIRHRGTRVGRNPKKGTVIMLPPMETIGFNASKRLKYAVRKGVK